MTDSEDFNESAGTVTSEERQVFRQVWSFTAWPAEGRWERSMYELFRLYPRVEMEVGEGEFAAFVDSLERQGITLREVERQVASGRKETGRG